MITEPNAFPEETEDVWLAVWGLFCEECDRRVRDALLRIPGVLAAEVDWNWMGARVTAVRNAVNPDDLVVSVGNLEDPTGHPFWAAAGPEVTETLQLSWELRRLSRMAPARAGRSPAG